MGLIANYQYLSDENLKELKEFSGSEDDPYGTSGRVE